MNCKEFFLLEIEYITFPGRDTGGVTEGALKKKKSTDYKFRSCSLLKEQQLHQSMCLLDQC